MENPGSGTSRRAVCGISQSWFHPQGWKSQMVFSTCQKKPDEGISIPTEGIVRANRQTANASFFPSFLIYTVYRSYGPDLNWNFPLQNNKIYRVGVPTSKDSFKEKNLSQVYLATWLLLRSKYNQAEN